jgi:hypothetical protein
MDESCLRVKTRKKIAFRPVNRGTKSTKISALRGTTLLGERNSPAQEPLNAGSIVARYSAFAFGVRAHG